MLGIGAAASVFHLHNISLAEQVNNNNSNNKNNISLAEQANT